MNKDLLTIFTPTFNRTNDIKKLADSLLNQTCFMFCWLVIDDGSYNDETLNYVENFSRFSPFNIIYYKKKNEGKYKAYNFALTKIKTEYFCCVDDDDVINKDFVKIVIDKIKQLSPKVGLVFPRNCSINLGLKEVDITDIWQIYKIKVETTIVTKSEVAIKFPFPDFKNEKFASEEIVYNMLSKVGKFLFINIPICYSEYKSGGLTKNLFALWRNNVNSSICLFKSRYLFFKKAKFIKRIILRIRCLSNYYSVVFFNNKVSKIEIIGNFMYLPICFSFGFIIFLKKKHLLK